MSVIGQEIYYDPFDYEIQKDPYEVFRDLRDHAPLYHVAEHDLWVLSRYEDIRTVIFDWETYSNREGVDIDKTDTLLSPGNMDEKDGAQHDKYRRLVHQWFGPKQIRENLVEPLRKETEALVSAFRARGGGDVVAEVAWELPTLVLTIMFDAPDADRAKLGSFMKPVFERIPNDPVPPAAAFESGEKITQWCLDLIEKRRTEPLTGRPDILSMLIRSELDGAPLDDQQILGIVSHLIVASSGTTQDLISNAVWLLGNYPDERAKLLADPKLADKAIEECLRFEAVVQSVSRVTNREVEFYGQTIPKGATVVNLLGSANRDERKWPEPDRFDITREPNGLLSDVPVMTGGHLSFADGIHMCIGRPIARLEAKLVVEEFLRQMPDYRPSAPPVRAVSHVARGFEHVYIESGR